MFFVDPYERWSGVVSNREGGRERERERESARRRRKRRAAVESNTPKN
jgi:hypothetical protein